MTAPLLDVRDLQVTFGKGERAVQAVRGVSFELGRERLAIVGESGSGKSVTVRSLLGLAGPSANVTAAHASFRGADLLSATSRQIRSIRGDGIAMVVQDPRHGLNPLRTVSQQIEEMIVRAPRRSGTAAKTRLLELLDDVHIRDPERVSHLYPHQLSGGMAQRVMIAMMMAREPDVLIADEATSALDVPVQQRILEIIDEQVRRRGMGLILISHDLDLVASYSDRTIVMYAGRIVDSFASNAAGAPGRHPYTRGLIACRPSLSHPGGVLPTLQRDPAWLE